MAACPDQLHAEGRPSWRCFPTDLSANTNNLGLIRLAMALLVVFSHCFPLATGDIFREPLKRFTGTISFGDVGVNGFFVLSGFLISHSFLSSRSVVEFLIRRVRRIYPAFIVVCLLGVFVVSYIGLDYEPGYFQQISIWRVGACLLLLWNYQVSPVFLRVPFVGYANGVLWTIPMEFKCYLLVAAMGLTKLLNRRWIVTAIFVAAYIGYAIQLPHKPTHGPANEWPRFLTYFAAGMTFYCHRGSIPWSRAIAIGCGAVILLACFSGTAIQLISPICGTYLLFAAAFARKARLKGLGDQVDLSYGVYLYAYPLQQLIMNAIRHPIAPTTLLAMVLPPLFLCSAASWFIVERPLLKRSARHKGFCPFGNAPDRSGWENLPADCSVSRETVGEYARPAISH